MFDENNEDIQEFMADISNNDEVPTYLLKEIDNEYPYPCIIFDQDQ